MSHNFFVGTFEQNRNEQKIQSPLLNSSIFTYLNFVLSCIAFKKKISVGIEATDLTPAGERYQPGAK